MLLGISTVQLCTSPHARRQSSPVTTAGVDIYHVSFPNDRWFIRDAVYIIYLLDIFQSIVAASEAWQFLVAGWGRQINLEYPGWTFTALPIVSSLGECCSCPFCGMILESERIRTHTVAVSLGVQTFYAWRIWQLGRWRVIPGIIIFVSPKGDVVLSRGLIAVA